MPRIRSPSQRPGTALSAPLGWALADHDLVGHEVLSAPGTGFRGAQRPSSAQTSGQLAPERAAALHIERVVDRLVRNRHRFFIREVAAETVRHLLRLHALARRRSMRRPWRRPIHTTRGPATGIRSGRSTSAGEPVLHIEARVIDGILPPSETTGPPTGSGTPASWTGRPAAANTRELARWGETPAMPRPWYRAMTRRPRLSSFRRSTQVDGGEHSCFRRLVRAGRQLCKHRPACSAVRMLQIAPPRGF